MSAFALKLVSPLAGGLFQRTIAKGGSPFVPRVRTLDQAEHAGVERDILGATELADPRAPTAALLGTARRGRVRRIAPLTIDGCAVRQPGQMMAEGGTRRHSFAQPPTRDFAGRRHNLMLRHSANRPSSATASARPSSRARTRWDRMPTPHARRLPP
jgi:hypothetical protein